MSTHNMFLWRTEENYPLIIINYPPSLDLFLFQLREITYKWITALFFFLLSWQLFNILPVKVLKTSSTIVGGIEGERFSELIWIEEILKYINEYHKFPKYSDSQKICC